MRQLCCVALCFGGVHSILPLAQRPQLFPLLQPASAAQHHQRYDNRSSPDQKAVVAPPAQPPAQQRSQKRRRRRRYRSPDNARIPQRDHSGGGVRGCGEEIVAIAPRVSSIGQTAATHPTFIWHSQSSSAEPLEFHLYRYRSSTPAEGQDSAQDQDSVQDPVQDLETVLIQRVDDSRQGYMSYTLPADMSGLKAGEIYLWQVVLYCDPNLEEVGMWTAADIEIVSAPAAAPSISDGAVASSLSAAANLAEAGLWYDAIAAVYGANSPAAIDFRQDLLADLIELESTAAADQTAAIVSQLQQILEMD